MNSSVRIRQIIYQKLLEAARPNPAEECCGLLAGRDGLISTILPAVNALSSQSKYEIAPEELFRLMREIRAAGLELMGIYHSHPNGENRPSERDIERAYYPDAAYFIVSPRPDAPNPIRAFSINEGRVNELAIKLEAELSHWPADRAQ
ncbi:MAG: M67 family metallopeptidase [Candidatus Acidiferrales bacterium]